MSLVVTRARSPRPSCRPTRLALAIALSGSLLNPVWAAPVMEQVTVDGHPDQLPDTTGDAAQLLKQDGVQFYSAGGIARLPVLRGLNDDRVKLVIDGAETTSACANHMNPALSYIDASRVQSVEVLAGITPVSLGGDSIAGTIVINSVQPRYAEQAGQILRTGDVGVFYKSNNRNHSQNARLTVADSSKSLTYTGSNDKAASYRDGNGDTVLDTLYRAESHNLTFGARGAEDELIVRLTHQEVPYQGFPNQYMDMVGNVSNGINVNYLRDFSWGRLDTRVNWQDVDHEMGFFSAEKTGTMPMLTEGENRSIIIKGELPLSERYSLRLGHELHQFRLNDWWPPVAGSMMMGPDTFVNINDGEKTRYAFWAESDYRLNDHWQTQTGLRYEHVVTDAGAVQPYNTLMGGMMGNPDAAAALAFNARNRTQQDDVFDLTLLARYQPSAARSIEFGYARKTRTPNLYERYSWGRGTMAMTMVGWFGDGNAYVGAIDLNPEIAHTLSTTLRWQDAARDNWELAATPYYTYVDDFIDANVIGSFNPRMAMGVTRPALQFANLDADLYGIDLNGKRNLWDHSRFGKGSLNGLLGYTHGERSNGDALYHILPLTATVTLEQNLRGWTHSIAVEWVDDKQRVDPRRMEDTTDSYTLVNIGTRYRWQQLTLSLGVRNLLDEQYELPLGGVNIARWRADDSVGQLPALNGEGRSVDMGIQYQF